MKEQGADSQLTLAILGLLSTQPMSGYGLRKAFMNTAIKAYSSSPGAIYPALRRLEKEGRIAGTIERQHTLRPRAVFTLTPKGKASLIESLMLPVTRDDVILRMDSLFLRYSFMSGLVGGAEIAAFLEAMVTETEAYIQKLEQEFREMAPKLPFTGRTAFELGIKSLRTTLLWARETLMALRQQNLPGETDEQ